MSKIFGIVILIGLAVFIGYSVFGIIDDIKAKKKQNQDKKTEKVLSNVEPDKQDNLEK